MIVHHGSSRRSPPLTACTLSYGSPDEVANLRTLLVNLNTMASNVDEASCLGARMAAALKQPGRIFDVGDANDKATMQDVGATSMDLNGEMDRALALLGLGVS